jgi:hypothetical protein
MIFALMCLIKYYQFDYIFDLYEALPIQKYLVEKLKVGASLESVGVA